MIRRNIEASIQQAMSDTPVARLHTADWLSAGIRGLEAKEGRQRQQVEQRPSMHPLIFLTRKLA